MPTITSGLPGSSPISMPTASPIKAALYRKMDLGRLETVALDRIQNANQYFKDINRLAAESDLLTRFENHNVSSMPSGDVQAMIEVLIEKGRPKLAWELKEADAKFRKAYSFETSLRSRLYDGN